MKKLSTLDPVDVSRRHRDEVADCRRWPCMSRHMTIIVGTCSALAIRKEGVRSMTSKTTEQSQNADKVVRVTTEGARLSMKSECPSSDSQSCFLVGFHRWKMPLCARKRSCPYCLTSPKLAHRNMSKLWNGTLGMGKKLTCRLVALRIGQLPFHAEDAAGPAVTKIIRPVSKSSTNDICIAWSAVLCQGR